MPLVGGGSSFLSSSGHLSSWIQARAAIPQCLSAAEELLCESLGKPLAVLEPQLQLMLTSAALTTAQLPAGRGVKGLGLHTLDR